ncbi:DUF4189 domain-containing protein [Sinorhizobium meliloti]|uniref:DUF4189 domain-containing protein n=1 Tax=Rhizobium meliloti TaxID=382 RepID=UPI0001E4C7C9|nr:DUF4189 domain-containing protein [Sinorhizobium meliloti]AEG06863.1 hypothetical protein SinmeB_5626 [Sinorhizobium meliloti BL225C]ASP54037.1 DUF4189 domain-containing protein [Sinorhizobium meliloti]MDE3774414.1 DUF4189 domain-containing protein [Sinorhizobium meliloti]MDE4548155.1 DUF4189 domain-containing protein [Sinorhizobium meliloti]MDE4571774.1 DUF4189 domain-containing protein [Sinorhizobium meliloti]
MRLRFIFGAAGMVLLSAARLSAADLSATEADIPVPLQEEKAIWAAIAYSKSDGKHGFFWGADKRQEAMDIALEHCERNGGNACVVVSVFRNHRHWDDDDNTGIPYNHCGALAVGEETPGRLMGWGAKSAQTRREAEDLALQVCERSGDACKIREWVCT